MKLTALLGFTALFTLSACAGEDSVTVDPMQKKDKKLSCNEIQLEINEAEFYKKTAENNKNPGVRGILMPLGYISTYMNADHAQDAANARIDYLNRIYTILQCDQQPQQQAAQPQAMGAPVMPAQPRGVIMVPMNQQMAQPQTPSDSEQIW